MEVSQLALARLLAVSFLTGVLLAVLADFYWTFFAGFVQECRFVCPEFMSKAEILSYKLRVRRKLYMPLSQKNALNAGHLSKRICSVFRFLTEFATGFGMALSMILVLYVLNKGVFRLSALLLCLAGFIVYRLLLRHIIGTGIQCGSVVCIRLMQWILAIVTFPVRILVAGSWRLFLWLARKCTTAFKLPHNPSVQKKDLCETHKIAAVFHRGGK